MLRTLAIIVALLFISPVAHATKHRTHLVVVKQRHVVQLPTSGDPMFPHSPNQQVTGAERDAGGGAGGGGGGGE